MASAKSFTVYVSLPLSRNDEASLLYEFNLPDAQSSSPSDQLALSIEPALGLSIKEIVDLHTSNRPTQNHRTIFVVADEGMSPSTYPHTVLIVNTLSTEGTQTSDVAYQAFRVLTSIAATVLKAITSGNHGWEDFWQIAQASGGRFPGQ